MNAEDEEPREEVPMSDRHLSLRCEERLGANECTLIQVRPSFAAHVVSGAALIRKSSSAGNSAEVST